MEINVQKKREAKIRFAATLLFRGTLISINFFINTRFAFLFWTLVTVYFLYYSSYYSPFELRSVLDRFSFGSRSFFDQFSFILRSSSVHSPFGNRRSIEDWSKNERRIIGGKTEMYRNSNGKPRERCTEENFICYHLNSNYYGKTYSRIHHFSAPLHSAYWKSMSYVKDALTKSGEDTISGKQ